MGHDGRAGRHGASITSISGSVLRELGVELVDSQRFRFAQGEVRTMPIGYTWVRFAGKEVLTQVLFNEESSPALPVPWLLRAPTWG